MFRTLDEFEFIKKLWKGEGNKMVILLMYQENRHNINNGRSQTINLYSKSTTAVKASVDA